MKTEHRIEVRAFPVVIQAESSDKENKDFIVLDKQHLQAAQMVGQSSKEIIYRLYNRKGIKVLDIGKPFKKTISINLEELYRLHGGR